MTTSLVQERRRPDVELVDAGTATRQLGDLLARAAAAREDRLVPDTLHAHPTAGDVFLVHWIERDDYGTTTRRRAQLDGHLIRRIARRSTERNAR